MDSKESEANNQDVMLQQQQSGYTPYPMSPPEYQHPGDTNQGQMQDNPGYKTTPVPPPQYLNRQYDAYPNQPVPAQQMSDYQPCVVVNQPMIQHYPQHMVGEPPIPNYLYLSIFTTLCCCCCLGIGAIVTSSQANSMKYSEPREAKRKAETALRLNIIGIVIGVIIAIAYAVLRFAVMTQ